MDSPTDLRTPLASYCYCEQLPKQDPRDLCNPTTDAFNDDEEDNLGDSDDEDGNDEGGVGAIPVDMSLRI
jgi:hypothetical protein